MKNLSVFFEKYQKNLTKIKENQFEKYFLMILDTNKKFNLTSITEEDEVVKKHFLDSVLPENLFSKNSTVVDIGSGAGFPGIPLAIYRPDLKISLVDSLSKRVNFLNDVIQALELSNVSATHARAEDFCVKHREQFDFATARAVARLDTLVEYLLPLVRVGGKVVVYKSQKLNEEIDGAKNAIKILGGKISQVLNFDLDGEERNILLVEKISHTPSKYPRGQNKPKNSPIK